MRPFSRNQPPDLLTCLAHVHVSLVLCLPRDMHLSTPACASKLLQDLLLFWQGAESLAPATQNDASNGQCMGCFQHLSLEMCRVPQRCALFQQLNFRKCSKHGVFCMPQLLKNVPNMVCLVHFTFEMCFVQQRRLFLQRLNFQKCSRHGVHCTF